MKIRLSPSAFIRHYGPYSYVVNARTAQDFVFSDARCFLDCITRNGAEFSNIIRALAAEFVDVNEVELRQDYLEFIAPLVFEKIVCVDDETPELSANIQQFNFQRHNDQKSEAPISTRDLLDAYFQKTPTPFTLQMDISQACTERCIHCYIPRYTNIFMPLDKIKNVLDEFKSMGGLVLSLSGGECMMHPNFIEILQYAHSKDLMIKVLSNLTLCDEKIVEALKETGAEVQTSLYSMDCRVHDSITQKIGSWGRTKWALEKLHEQNVSCIISCPMMRVNQDEYPAVRKYANGLGFRAQADFMIIAKMDGDTRNLSCRMSAEKIEILLRYLAKLSVEKNRDYFSSYFKSGDSNQLEWLDQCLCSAGVSRICLGTDGSYYPCPGFGGYVVGNCFENDLGWVWDKSPNMLKLRTITGRDLVKCSKCQERKYCSICLCRNFNETGNMLMPTEFDCMVAKINRKVVESYRNA